MLYLPYYKVISEKRKERFDLQLNKAVLMFSPAWFETPLSSKSQKSKIVRSLQSVGIGYCKSLLTHIMFSQIFYLVILIHQSLQRLFVFLALLNYSKSAPVVFKKKKFEERLSILFFHFNNETTIGRRRQIWKAKTNEKLPLRKGIEDRVDGHALLLDRLTFLFRIVWVEAANSTFNPICKASLSCALVQEKTELWRKPLISLTR
jgi:hypothetical protein